MKFTKTLYTKIDGDGNEKYFVASEKLIDMADLGEKRKVGVYILKEIIEVEGIVSSRALRRKA